MAIYQIKNPRWMGYQFFGPDAADFLQRLSTVDVKNLKLGQSIMGSLLSPVGKLVVLFFLYRKDNEEFLIELDPGKDGSQAQKMEAYFEQYHFGENWTLRKLEADQVPTHLVLTAGESLNILSLIHHPEKIYGQGRQWITHWSQNTEFLGAQVLNPTARETWRIEAMFPSTDGELANEVIPLEVNLSHAIAPNKGCYPGQEVIERIWSKGAPPRRLVHLLGVGQAPTIPFSFSEGVITSVSQVSQEGFVALAIIQKKSAEEGKRFQFSDTSSGMLTKIAPYSF